METVSARFLMTCSYAKLSIAEMNIHFPREWLAYNTAFLVLDA